MDTMMTFGTQMLSDHFMTKEEVMNKCPLAFKTNPTNAKVSDKYVMVTTADLIDDMAKLGWFPVEAKQNKATKRSSGVRSFHMISFQNPDIVIYNQDGGIEAYPRIILTNSHDGFNSFKFMCGVFRLVCSNGLVVCDQNFESVTIRHINYSFEELRKTVSESISFVSKKINDMNVMTTKEMTDEQMRKFAKEAVAIRKGEETIEVSDKTIDDILNADRKEDEGNSVWKVFNRIQEKIVKGRFGYAKNDFVKQRKARAITSISKDLEINKRLFKKAMEYAMA